MKMKLTIIVPCYNEAATLERVIDALEKVSLPDGWEREIIAVDDGSTDDTARLLHEFEARGRVRALFHPGNSGKGRAVKTGLAAATGDYILIQDADAEYDPADIPRLITALKENDSVFGSRNLGTNNVPYNATFFYGGLLVTKLFNMVFRTRLSDIATCYKLFPRRFIPALLASDHDDFVFDAVHMTRTLVALGSIVEVPISYRARTREQGKKLTVTHAGKIVTALFLSRIGLTEARHISMTMQIIRFLITGTLTASINLTALYLLTEYAGIWYIYSSILAFAVAFSFNFTLQKYWVFQSGEHTKIPRQLPLHLGVALVNLVINTILLYLLVEYVHVWYVLAQAIASAIIAVETFFALRWIFK